MIETSSIGAEFQSKNQSALPPRQHRRATAPTISKYFRPTALRHIGMHCNNKIFFQDLRTTD